ncbi:MAG: nucleotidyl transferase AbiEii/AbiGii toxin family protein [Candidatus ainarchaeum sp.]|nr:nucleotidyl transferase AbiEii/AbiGii toxin family protein [Candidatus ainarchaeum sp.]
MDIELPLFEVIVLSKKEILLEKIRTILTREKARDLYDFYYLTQTEIVTKKEIQEKLDTINKKFDLKELDQAINRKERLYETEIKRLVKNYPNFFEIKEQLQKYFKKIV